MKTIFFSIFFLALTSFAKDALNVDEHGLALQGYDPVGYFTDGKAVKGSADLTAAYQGGTYQFASADHKALFEKEPAKYAPQFGGFCGYAASINKLVPIMPEFFQVLHGRLVLQHNEKAWTLWHEDVEGNLKKADANWPTLSQQPPPAPEVKK